MTMKGIRNFNEKLKKDTKYSKLYYILIHHVDKELFVLVSRKHFFSTIRFNHPSFQKVAKSENCHQYKLP